MKFRPIALCILGAAAAVYGMAYVDLTLRARSAYMEGEKYLEWSRHPELKKAYLDGVLAREDRRWRGEFDRGRISADELEERLRLARFERDQRESESALKYAYIWFQTAVELFSPPESRWVKLSRREMGKTKELWAAELKARGVSFQEYMLE